MSKPLPPLALWLFACAALLFVTTQVGAVTRLTESGLSIVEWKPVTGALPPLNAADWTHEFSLYQTSPQYKKVNTGMTLEDFKHIYFWEWLHRLLDRVLGIVYFVPFVLFWRRGKIPDTARKPLSAIFILGAVQGTLGWYMVKSGLVDRPAVSPYLLAAHLMLAVTIFCCLLRMGFIFSVMPEKAAKKLLPLRGLVRAAVAMVALTMIWGAFTAGLRAGQIYNDTFPLMGAHLWPGELFHDAPWWSNFFENPAAVQFTHRVLAVLTFCTLTAVAAKGLPLQDTTRLRYLLAALGVMACAQVCLGIATLLTHVDIAVATLHQAGALTILALLMALLHNIPDRGDKHALPD
jgi:cytochrome c oxidase assembly protein subunit 15